MQKMLFQGLCEARIIGLHSRVTHPFCHTLPHALFEGKAEGAIASIATVVGQLMDGEGTLRSNGLVVETDEMIDTQIVNIRIVSRTLTGEILAQIRAVSTGGGSELDNGQVVL
jgi:hypothetical protein